MGRSGSLISEGFPVVAVCLAALLLSNAMIYLYLDSLYQTDERLVSSHVGHVPQHFKITNMKNITPWLQCSQIDAEVRKLKLIGQGTVKKVGSLLKATSAFVLTELKEGNAIGLKSWQFPIQF